MDDAEEELELSEDPFLEAGIEIPTNLPGYVNKSAKAMQPDSGNTMDNLSIHGMHTNLSRSPSIRSAIVDKVQVGSLKQARPMAMTTLFLLFKIMLYTLF